MKREADGGKLFWEDFERRVVAKVTKEFYALKEKNKKLSQLIDQKQKPRDVRMCNCGIYVWPEENIIINCGGNCSSFCPDCINQAKHCSKCNEIICDSCLCECAVLHCDKLFCNSDTCLDIMDIYLHRCGDYAWVCSEECLQKLHKSREN